MPKKSPKCQSSLLTSTTSSINIDKPSQRRTTTTSSIPEALPLGHTTSSRNMRTTTVSGRAASLTATRGSSTTRTPTSKDSLWTGRPFATRVYGFTLTDLITSEGSRSPSRMAMGRWSTATTTWSTVGSGETENPMAEELRSSKTPVSLRGNSKMESKLDTANTRGPTVAPTKESSRTASWKVRAARPTLTAVASRGRFTGT